MNKKLELQIMNLAKIVFEDKDYNSCMHYLKTKQLNNLRLLISERYDLLNMVSDMNPDDQVLSMQKINCDEMENIVINMYELS